MPNFCAAPNCSRKSTKCPDVPFFRFPRDPVRCRKWVENCRRADLEDKSSEQLHKQYRLCARHFETSLICTNSPYRTILKDDAVPTLFDLTSHLKKPESKHKKQKRIRELSEEDLQRIKAPRNDADVLRGLQCIQDANQANGDKGGHESPAEKWEELLPQDTSLNLTPEEKGNKEFLKVLFETVLLLGRQNVPLGGCSSEDTASPCCAPNNIRALLEFRMNAGDEILRKRFETMAEYTEYCPKNLQRDLLAICEMCIRKEVLREMRENFFSIVTDEVVDISGLDHVSLHVRFVDNMDCLREEFLGFVQCELEGEALADRLQETLTEKWGLNMDNCRGQAYNGSGSMSYKKHALASKILQQYPKALCTSCSSYPLNIWIAKSTPIFSVTMVLSLMDSVQAFFSLSSQLQTALEASIDGAFQATAERAKELKSVCQGSWTERHDTFEFLTDLYDVLVTCLDGVSYNICGKWSAYMVTQASMLSSTMRDFEMVMCLVVMKNVLGYTRAFGKNLQGHAADTYFASGTLTAVLHSLNEMRENLDVYHEFWLEEATHLAHKMAIEMKAPRRCLGQATEGSSEESPDHYYREALTTPFLDYVIAEVKGMFCEEQLKALKCLSLVPSVMAQLNYNTTVEITANLYKDDLPNPDTLSAELHCWRIKWKHRSRDVELPNTVFDTLQHPDIKFFPNVYTLLKIVCNLPIIKVGSERSEVGRRRLKAYLKATPVEERASSLALMHINYDAKHDFDMMVDTFAKLYPEKMQLPNVLDFLEACDQDSGEMEVAMGDRAWR
uniref:52 kDa repressor of the inhibitor of the protein kinase n=1 Tax=Callorhinchus milii TaxID=7868 RepID=V9KAI4_CALMI